MTPLERLGYIFLSINENQSWHRESHMKKTLILACLAALTAGAAFAASLAEPIVNYQFQVRLDPAKKTVAGSEVLTWLAPSICRAKS